VDRWPFPAADSQYFDGRECGQHATRAGVNTGHTALLRRAERAVVQDDREASALPASGHQLRRQLLPTYAVRAELTRGGDEIGVGAR
jgi:hypothetical protein